MAVFLAAVNRYSAAADLILELPLLTVDARSRLGISTTVQAQQMGIAKTTLTNLEAGSNPTQSTILAVLRWLASH